MSGSVIVSLCVGKNPDYRACVKFHRAYAQYWGHDYILFEKEVFRVRPNWFKKRRVGFHFEKFQVKALLEKYERVFFLDADVIPTISAPDIFSQVQPGHWGCVPEPSGENDWKFEADLSKFERRLGKLPDTCARTYFNSGILVFDRSHAAIWEWKPEEVFSGRWPEQTLLNYRIMSNATATLFLDQCYNFTPQSGPDWANNEFRRRQFFIHYASQPGKQALQGDLDFHAQQWKAHTGS